MGMAVKLRNNNFLVILLISWCKDVAQWCQKKKEKKKKKLIMLIGWVLTWLTCWLLKGRLIKLCKMCFDEIHFSLMEWIHVILSSVNPAKHWIGWHFGDFHLCINPRVEWLIHSSDFSLLGSWVLRLFLFLKFKSFSIILSQCNEFLEWSVYQEVLWCFWLKVCSGWKVDFLWSWVITVWVPRSVFLRHFGFVFN